MPTCNHTQHRQVSLGFTPELYPEGTHICYLFNDDEEHKRFLSAYTSSGIDSREGVTYIADVEPDMLQETMARLGVAMPSQEQQDQFTAKTAVATYCPDGHFVPDDMLGRLRDAYETKCAAGYAGARLTGEMTWALRNIPGSDRLVEYEGRINELLLTYPLTTLCQYDTRRFGGATIFEILSVHPMMIVNGQIMRNPFYIPSDKVRSEQQNA